MAEKYIIYIFWTIVLLRWLKCQTYPFILLTQVDYSSSTEPCLMEVSYQLIYPLPSPGIELTLFGYLAGSNLHLYPLYHVSLNVYEFLGIISLMSSATIFTSAHIAILLLSLHFFFLFFIDRYTRKGSTRHE